MREAAANLEFEEAARLRDEVKRLQAVELAIGSDPMASQREVEGRRPGGYGGDAEIRPRRPTCPRTARTSRRTTEMGPHNFRGRRGRPAEARAHRAQHGGQGRVAGVQGEAAGVMGFVSLVTAALFMARRLYMSSSPRAVKP